jgi:hypothetical protein
MSQIAQIAQITLPSMQTRFLTSQMCVRSVEREMARRKRLAIEYGRQRMERSKRREMNRKNRARAEDIFQDNMLQLIEQDRKQDRKPNLLERFKEARQVGETNRAFIDAFEEELNRMSRVFQIDDVIISRKERAETILGVYRFMNLGLENYICNKLRIPSLSETENVFYLILVIYLKIRELESSLTHNDGELEITLRWEMNATKKIVVPIIREMMDESVFNSEESLNMFREVRSMI